MLVSLFNALACVHYELTICSNFRVLIALSASTSDPLISHALASPSTELQFMHMKVS